MNIRLRGNNSFACEPTGMAFDTLDAGKVIALATAGVARLTLTDANATFSGVSTFEGNADFQGNVNISTTMQVGGNSVLEDVEITGDLTIGGEIIGDVTITGVTTTQRLTEGYLLLDTADYVYSINVDSPKNLRFWGTTAGAGAELPDSTTVPAGTTYTIYNTSTVSISISREGYFPLTTLESNYSITVVNIDPAVNGVGSWKITSIGIPNHATAGLVLTSNGSVDLPSYKNVYPNNSSGTFTPALYLRAGGFTTSPILQTTTTTSSYTAWQISTNIKMVNVSIVFNVTTVNLSGTIASMPVITGLPFYCDRVTSVHATVLDMTPDNDTAQVGHYQGIMAPIGTDRGIAWVDSEDGDTCEFDGYNILFLGGGFWSDLLYKYTLTNGDKWQCNFNYYSQF